MFNKLMEGGMNENQNEKRTSKELAVSAGVKNRYTGEVIIDWSAVKNLADLLHDAAQRGQSLNYADLSSNSPPYLPVDLENAHLEGAKLTDADLSSSNLAKANFKGANLTRAWITKAKASLASFAHADLRYANLACGDFRNANFEHADLRGASFAYADLRGANLSVAILTETNFEGAKLDTPKFTEADRIHEPSVGVDLPKVDADDKPV